MPRILIVDDSKFTRNVIKRALADTSHELCEAINGKEALDKVDQFDPDCIITDLLMPEVDGIELLTHLRSNGDDRPVCVITADIQESAREQCNSLGVSGFLNKPFKAPELLNVVDTMLCQLKGA